MPKASQAYSEADSKKIFRPLVMIFALFLIAILGLFSIVAISDFLREYCMKKVTEYILTFSRGDASYKSQVSILRNLELDGYCQYQYIDLYLFS